MRDSKKPVMPMNIQFFAEPEEPNNEPTPQEPQPNNEPKPEQNEPQISAEEQIAKLTAQLNAYKKSVDKATSDASEWKKRYRATLDEKTKLDEEKIERETAREQEYQELKKKVAISDMKATFLDLGYSKEMAEQAANAQYENDFTELTKIQKAFIESERKASVAKYMKTQPVPPAGNEGDVDPFLAAFGKK